MRARGVVRLGLFAGVTAWHGLWLGLASWTGRLDGPQQARITQAWGRAICRAIGIRVEVAGELPRERALCVANHRSYADIPALAACTPLCFVAKSEVMAWPLLGAAAMRAGTIFVKRDDVTSGAKALRRMRVTIAANISIAVFPEGTTVAGPGTGRFRTGAFRLAIAARIPVVPIAIEYARTSDAWTDPDDRSFIAHFVTCFSRREVPVRIAFGEPLASRDAETLRADTERWISAHLSPPAERGSSLDGALPV